MHQLHRSLGPFLTNLAPHEHVWLLQAMSKARYQPHREWMELFFYASMASCSLYEPSHITDLLR